jgi:hypothetical protein
MEGLDFSAPQKPKRFRRKKAETPDPNEGLAPPVGGTVVTTDEGEEVNVFKMLKEKERQKDVLAWVEEQYSRCRSQRTQIEQRWYLNLSFYFGKQYVNVVNSQASPLGYSLKVPDAPPWRVRLTINKIRTIVRTEVAKLTQNRPMPVVVPASTDDHDQASARVAEQILRTALMEGSFNKTLRSWIWWGTVTGTSFLKAYWDPNNLDNAGNKGTVFIERVNPFHILVPDLLEEDLESQPYVIHLNTRTVEWVKKFYGITTGATTNQSSGLLDNAFLNMMGAQQTPADSVLVKEVWIKPGATELYPQGGLVIIVGDKIVYDNDQGIPYQHKEFPFYKYDGIPTGQFYGESNVTDLIPLQKEYNRRRSQIVEAGNLMGKPQLMVTEGAVNPRKITSEPGQVIQVRPGYQMPTAVPLTPLPAYVVQELDRLTIEMDDISGQHEITRGQNPAQVTAATAISFLQEQDDTKLAYQVHSVEDAVAKLGRHYLRLVTQYWDEARLIRIVGNDGAFESKMWQASDLSGNTDVRVEAGSALPTSKAARSALLMEMYKMGAIAPEQFLELMDMGNIEKAYEDYLIDKRQSQRENLKMSELNVLDVMMRDPADLNPLVEVNTWDNHQAHIHFHNQFRKTQSFELLPDEIKEEFERHVNLHQMALTGYASPMGMIDGSGNALPPDGGAPMMEGDPNAPVEGAEGDPNAQPMPPEGGM